MYHLAAVLAALLLLTACGTVPGPAPAEQATPTADPASTPALPTLRPPFGPMEPELHGVVESVLEDAARRMDRRPQEFSLVRAEAGVWPDASLGCRRPNVAYADAETQGYWVVLMVAGIEVDYRVSADGQLDLCTIATDMREGPLR